MGWIWKGGQVMASTGGYKVEKDALPAQPLTTFGAQGVADEDITHFLAPEKTQAKVQCEQALCPGNEGSSREARITP